MTTPDDLRDRLAGIDPARDLPTDTATGARGRALLEDIMNAPLTDEQPETTPTSRTAPPAGRGSRRPWWIGAGAAAAVIAIVALGVAMLGDDADEPEQAGGGEAIELSLGEGQDAMASCLALSPEMLTPMPLAFAGTATAIDGERVVLDVTQWYQGGDAATVELTAPAGLEALIGGIDFQVGQSYLVSAADGFVNYCGFSGPDTPELRAIYDAAFAG